MLRGMLMAISLGVVVAACAEKPLVKVTAKAPPAVQTAARSEPIYYNGHRYHMTYTYSEPSQAFDVKVTGIDRAMKADDEKDAVNIVTSGVRYFACPNPQTARVLGAPQFGAGTWRLQAQCG